MDIVFEPFIDGERVFAGYYVRTRPLWRELEIKAIYPEDKEYRLRILRPMRWSIGNEIDSIQSPISGTRKKRKMRLWREIERAHTQAKSGHLLP